MAIEKNWLVEGVVTSPSFVIAYGNNGSGKTTLILDMAMAIAEGKPWLDHFPTKKGKVLWLNEDMMLVDFAERWQALEAGQGHKVKDNDILLADNWGVCFDVKTKAYKWTLEELTKAVQTVKPSLIVIDHFRAVANGINENMAHETSPILSNLRKLAQSFKCSIILMHHTNKSDRYSGSTDIAAKSDYAYRFKKKGNGIFTIDNEERQRFGEFNLEISGQFEEKNNQLVSASFDTKSTGNQAKSAVRKSVNDQKYDNFIEEVLTKIPDNKTSLAQTSNVTSYATGLKYIDRAIQQETLAKDEEGNIIKGLELSLLEFAK